MMRDTQKQIDLLEKKLDSLSKWSHNFSLEINSIRNEIYLLKSSMIGEQTPSNFQEEEKIVPEIDFNTSKIEDKPQIPIPPRNFRHDTKPKVSPINLEKFIGENLINKIGILITIIGIGIGASYAIEHNLINPLTKILLGYLSGFVILGTSYKLKAKYDNFSSVLLGGGFAVLYFMTFFAYSFYDLLPQPIAFLIMFMITGSTVYSALKFDKQIIAHFGLVGAYAVPFLLSNNTGNVLILFSYMTIINVGILLISFKKYWKALYYSAFSMTYMIYSFWYSGFYSSKEHFIIASVFITIFFGIFYAAFLVYKLRTKEKFAAFDLVLLFSNAFIFYSLSRTIADSHNFYKHFDGLLTFANAIIHSLVYLFIIKQENIDKRIARFVLGLVISFVTITVPVQFDGSWVTGFWITEAVILFWITSKSYEKIYEYFSYTLIVLSFLSLLFDWDSNYKIYEVYKLKEQFMFIFNVNFLNSMIFIIGLGIINFFKIRDARIISEEDDTIRKLISFSISGLLILVVFVAFGLEISLYWQQEYLNSAHSAITNGVEVDTYSKNYDLLRYHDIWLMNYSLIFLSILTYLNAKRYKIQSLVNLNLFANATMYAIFVFSGSFLLYMLSVSYLDNKASDIFQQSVFNILIKYLSYIMFALIFYTSFQYYKEKMKSERYLRIFDIFLYLSIFWMLSYELVTWMNYFDSPHTFKLGLSILWGLYSSFLIAYGIWKKKKHLRISAIVLFAITLLKLFFIDASHLATIPKTILFVTLGILLLVISFLYNKYKHIINDNTEYL